MSYALHCSSIIRRSAACIVAIAALGCGSTLTAPDAKLAELLGASVPTVVPPGTAFRVVGYFGRGPCDRVTRVVEPTPDSVSLALVYQIVPSKNITCPAILLRDSVVAQIGAAASRPFTVRLRQSGEPDSVIVVRAQ